ncbi:FadR/GntR family transcriptional regulator [Spelaeicoccus albus]|uniref:GntR family transcriptional repressor for pyruvate dehydrogenase complex n=1 Tax=Spelaeicoccus albus TaxID=1280376 RepID=A0A7Z0A9X2_9MICO|nr:FadR/GntR family transcriptional regulator [Spelaeicoccus albus]NYI65773.1 GntR family transcriptional repressor for pyruvate dehydrogenase complex [Spelaeicoccus albus]
MALTDDAITKIKGMILSGELRPGDRLPPEKELSERLGLSRNSLREAVKALDLVRVLDVRRGDGTYVTSLEPGLLADAVGFVVDLYQDRSILELFEVRRILEPAAGAMAAVRISDDEVERLRATMDGVDESTGVEELVSHDVRFHRVLSEASGNSYLAGQLELLAGQTVRARIWRGLTQQHAVARTLGEHAAILDAVAARDAELVRSLLTVHVAGVAEWLRRVVNKTSEP